ncbi:MAG: PepSY domain-containing protein [Nitrosomonas sp.]|nr:PepSY domain-containing protein [Nitrosomonas sp.]
MQRWKPAWQIKPSRFNYDLHRACGLWLWPVLLVLAWSGVAFNLKAVYQPVMSSVLNMRDLDALPRLDKPLETPGLDWRAAHQFGKKYIHLASEEYGFTVERAQSLYLDRIHGVYHYRVKTSHDYGKYGATTAVLNADTGAFVTLITPAADSSGDIIHRWIVWLHTARVFGLPMQILICMTGLIVVAFSITGTVIWWRKRASGQRQRTSGKNIKAGSPAVIRD